MIDLNAAGLGLFVSLSLMSFAQAGTVDIAPDQQWHTFDVDALTATDGGLDWIDIDGDRLTFRLRLNTPGLLNVVDAGFAGDSFELFLDGEQLALTSPSFDDSYPESKGLDFDAAFADARWSRGVYTLDAGEYLITGRLYRSALDDQGVALNATVGAISVTAVPEPAEWALMALGLSALIAKRRRTTTAGKETV